MSFNIRFYNNKSAPEKISKSLTELDVLSGTLKNETSIIDPVILVAADVEDIADANYMQIGLFNRYYFITDIKSVRANLVEVSAHVDVLMSYRSDIRDNKAIIKRSENNYNLYLNDGSLKTLQNPQIETKAFDPFMTTLEFVLAVAGS